MNCTKKYIFVFKLLFEHTHTHTRTCTVHEEQEQQKKYDGRISNYRQYISNSVAYRSTSDFTNLIIKPNHTFY